MRNLVYGADYLISFVQRFQCLEWRIRYLQVNKRKEFVRACSERSEMQLPKSATWKRVHRSDSTYKILVEPIIDARQHLLARRDIIQDTYLEPVLLLVIQLPYVVGVGSSRIVL